jgi:hypothetical protein
MALSVTDAHWLRTAAELVGLWQTQVGRTSADWEQAVEQYLGNRVDYVTVRGLAKVLSDGATFTTPATPLPPVELRARLFADGPSFEQRDLFHPITRTARLAQWAAELAVTPAELEAALYADRPSAQCLTHLGEDWTPTELLQRYNLELHRGVLYWASELTIELFDTFKDFWRYVKLFKLMFEAQALVDGYRVTLEGPISPFVKSTTRYGRQFAVFLPALLLCQRWQLQATVRLGPTAHPLTFTLDHQSPLTSHFARSGAFDSQLEADFAAEFAAKVGDQRGHWQLTREDEVLLLGDTVMIPDFAFTHTRDGRRALVEIVGFWHPDYLRRKLAKVRAANREDLILLVYEGVNLTETALVDVPGEVLYFAKKPVVKEVLAAVERRAR